MSKQIIGMKVTVEFDSGIEGSLELEEMQLPMAELPEFLTALADAIYGLDELTEGRATDVTVRV